MCPVEECTVAHIVDEDNYYKLGFHNVNYLLVKSLCIIHIKREEICSQNVANIAFKRGKVKMYN